MRLQRILSTLLFPLSVLLIFLLLFENRIVLPAWLQVAGRMHPLLLHFPVVLIVLYCIWILFIPVKSIEVSVRRSVGDWLLLLSALSAVITALMGLFLSREEGYDEEALLWHKWSGIGIALVAALWYGFRKKIEQSRWAISVTAIISLFGIVLAGHQGAGITHGQNFLLAPLLPEKHQPSVAIEDAMVFTHLVQPVLEAKCVGCHNSKKAKGELIMETPELLLKGGKSGALWDSTQPDLGLLLRRIHLPLEQKKHMPPQGKPQLTDEEMNILYHWIKGGASFTAKVIELPPADTLRTIAQQALVRSEIAEYDFEEADEKTVQQLSNSNRVIYPIAMESPALGVNFYNKEFFNEQQLKELLKVKEQVVSMDCSRMPLKDEDLKTLAQFSNLRHLIMNFTPITGKTLGELKKLKHLKTLSLAGTSVTKDQLAQLENFPQLQKVYIWNVSIPSAELETLKQLKGKIKYETGARTDTLVLKLNPPIFQNEEDIISGSTALQLKHYINGTVIRYSTDGSEPDSVSSKVYDGNVVLEKNTLVKTKAFKPGWISSDIAERFFFKSGYKIDSAILLTPADPKYAKGGARLFINLEKGSFYPGDGKWLGYRNNRMEAMLYFNQPVHAKNITVSALKNIGSYIMPPARLEVWGGEDPKKLRLLGSLTPNQPQKDEPAAILPFEFNFPETKLQYIKVIAIPVSVLPPWHPGKGDKGWVFVDEILVN